MVIPKKVTYEIHNEGEHVDKPMFVASPMKRAKAQTTADGALFRPNTFSPSTSHRQEFAREKPSFRPQTSSFAKARRSSAHHEDIEVATVPRTVFRNFETLYHDRRGPKI